MSKLTDAERLKQIAALNEQAATVANRSRKLAISMVIEQIPSNMCEGDMAYCVNRLICLTGCLSDQAVSVANGSDSPSIVGGVDGWFL